MENGSHIVPIPVEYIPDTPISQKSRSHHSASPSEPSTSKSRKPKIQSSMERELKALKSSSPYDRKQDLLINWTKSGYYNSPYTGTVKTSKRNKGKKKNVCFRFQL